MPNSSQHGLWGPHLHRHVAVQSSSPARLGSHRENHTRVPMDYAPSSEQNHPQFAGQLLSKRKPHLLLFQPELSLSNLKPLKIPSEVESYTAPEAFRFFKHLGRHLCEHNREYLVILVQQNWNKPWFLSIP